MDGFTLLVLISIALYVLKVREQRARVRLLASFLGPTQIEKLMGSLIDGYMRALDEKDPERRQQIWTILSNTEQSLRSQFQRFADDFAQVPTVEARVSTLPLALPYFDRVMPAYSFDMREALQLHARGIAAACGEEGMDEARRKQRAFTMTAELFLMQHSCHWFCKSRTVASMRLLARQKTTYEQVLEAVSASTRQAYRQLLGQR